MTYASPHETQQISHRSVGHGMGLPQALPPCSKEARTRTSKATQPAQDPKRHLLLAQERLSLAILPRDFFPSWKTVYHWFRKWRIDATFERLNLALRERLRIRLERSRSPARASSIPSRPRRAGSVANREVTTAARRYAGASGTCSWTRKVWSSEQRSTVLRYPTKTVSSCY